MKGTFFFPVVSEEFGHIRTSSKCEIFLLIVMKLRDEGAIRLVRLLCNFATDKSNKGHDIILACLAKKNKKFPFSHRIAKKPE